VYDHNALNGRQLGREYLTMAEILKEEGYATGGFVQNKLLNYKNNYDQGFDVFITDGMTEFANANRRVLVDFLLPVVVYNHLLERDRFTDEAISWMSENKGRKFFLFLQYFHPHIPYTPPSKYIDNSNYQGVIDGSLAQSRDIRNGELEVTREDIDYMVGLYEGEIRYADEQIRIIYEYLEKAGIFDNTILLITADHGENMFEHTRHFAHGNQLYESTVHIPLIVSFPHGGQKPGRVKNMIRDVDYLSLVLELAEIRHGSLNTRPDLYINPDLAILGITCNSDQVLLYAKFDTLKYIVNVRTMQDELYDLAEDRHELHNLCSEKPELCSEYREIVMTEIKENQMIGDYIASSCIDEKHDNETENLLRSLGYIQ
jgi:arylsulfatase A-like enzyme